jgi:hypothetical protein
MSLRLGFILAEFPRGLEIVPHAQIAATSVGGVDGDATYALADGEVGVQFRYTVVGLRPYAAVGYPLWHTIEVERERQRRNYARSGGSADLTLAAGIEVPLFFLKPAGLDVGISRARGRSGLLEIFDEAEPVGSDGRFREEAVDEPYSVWRVYVGYSGPFSLVDPFPGL